MSHIVLLGDSIFDNARYVPGGPSVIAHLQRILPAGSRATLLAVDGSVVANVFDQVRRVPADATHLVVSVGGNNALAQSGPLFREPVASVAEALAKLGEVLHDFRREYQDMLIRVCSLGRPTAICTVYDNVPGLSPAEKAGLAQFNEAILREAARSAVPVIDLRLICHESSDYSAMSPIEPSATGGGKIARAIERVVAQHDFAAGGCRVFA